jgi:hypothetical protein
MATKKKAAKKAAKKTTGNQTSDDKPQVGGLGAKPVTEGDGGPRGADSPYAS